MSPYQKRGFFFVFLLFLLQDNSYCCLVSKFQDSKLKMAIVVKNYQFGRKSAYFKTLITSKLIDLATRNKKNISL